MKIGLIDNDLCTKKGAHFPNLALMKLSGWHKLQGHDVELLPIDALNGLFGNSYDKIYCSKVFTDTKTPEYVYNSGAILGGTGFYFDKAAPLLPEIEHCMPDYELYSPKIINRFIANNRTQYFNDFDIGFTTRGCVRRCSFCINQNSTKVVKHSPLSEFISPKNKYIMLLDDNIVAYNGFEDIFAELNATGKPFVFKQGMDFRLLNERKMNIIFGSNYYSTAKDGSKGARIFHFAFDNYADREIIENKLNLHYMTKKYSYRLLFYVLTGFDRENMYDEEFFERDIYELLKRCEILFKYNAYPYIMLHENYKKNPNWEVIHNLKQLLNVPMLYTNKTIHEAITRFGKIKLLEYLHKNHSWFLELRYNSKKYS